MLIRNLTPQDAARYQSLRLQGLTECPTAFASSVEEEIHTPIETLAARMAPQADRVRIGAFIDDELVGMAGLKREDMKKLAHKAYIWGVYVAPAHRQKGIAAKLLAHTLSYAQEQLGVEQVNLGVNAANKAAIPLYEGLGFTSFGLERNFMRVEGVPQDEIHMVKFIS
jgi:RimJ/RimL family protein N-acetyltransferase